MPEFTQEGRPLAVTTPLGKDALLLVGFAGREAISELFSFELEVIAEDTTDVKFDAILGQKVTVAFEGAEGASAAGSPRASAATTSRSTAWRSSPSSGSSRGPRGAASSSRRRCPTS
jgi:uncharacterized protein involved in type VI secretion and phage assembly